MIKRLLIAVAIALFAAATLGGVGLADEGTDLHAPHVGTVWNEFNVEDDCGGVEAEVVWHFVLTRPLEGGQLLTATFENAGNVQDIGARAGGGAVHFYIGTGPDTLLGAKAVVGGEGNLVLSHVCYDEEPEPEPTPTPTPEPTPEPTETPTVDPTPDPEPEPTVEPEPEPTVEPEPEAPVVTPDKPELDEDNPGLVTGELPHTGIGTLFALLAGGIFSAGLGFHILRRNG